MQEEMLGPGEEEEGEECDSDQEAGSGEEEEESKEESRGESEEECEEEGTEEMDVGHGTPGNIIPSHLLSTTVYSMLTQHTSGTHTTPPARPKINLIPGSFVFVRHCHFHTPQVHLSFSKHQSSTKLTCT